MCVCVYLIEKEEEEIEEWKKKPPVESSSRGDFVMVGWRNGDEFYISCAWNFLDLSIALRSFLELWNGSVFVAVLCTYDDKKKTGRRYKVYIFTCGWKVCPGWFGCGRLDTALLYGRVYKNKIVKPFVSSSNFSEMKINGIIRSTGRAQNKNKNKTK